MYRQGIESLNAGDTVLARDEFDASAPLLSRRVEVLFKRTAYHLRILTLRSSSGEPQILKTTNEHPMYTAESAWTPAGELRAGDEILEAGGGVAVVEASEFEEHPRGIDVFNLRVAEAHTYLVRADGFDGEPVWVHNYPSSSGPVEGGSYDVVRRSNTAGEVHHMPAYSAVGNALGEENAPFEKLPGILMDDIDHASTASYGSSADAVEYRAA